MSAFRVKMDSETKKRQDSQNFHAFTLNKSNRI